MKLKVASLHYEEKRKPYTSETTILAVRHSGGSNMLWGHFTAVATAVPCKIDGIT